MDTVSDDEDGPVDMRPTPDNLLDFVPYACYQLEAPFRIKINKEIQGEYHKAEERKRGRRTKASAPAVPVPTSDSRDRDSDLTPPEYIAEVEDIVINAVMNAQSQILELVFNRCLDIPRMLLKILGISVPYQPQLQRITIRWGPLSTVGLYELSKFLFTSQICEMCLDDSPVAGRNYEVLLDRPTRLRYLSLARCKLDDYDCVKLAALLVHPLPAAKTLHILSLVSNKIGDKGACALGHVLRSNRVLQYLNLAGNQIQDLGATSIFRSLMEFSLTHDELLEKKTRYFEYLKLRNEVYTKCMQELINDKSHDEIRMTRRRTVARLQKKYSTSISMNTAGSLSQRAHTMTTERIGGFADPFSSDQTVLRGGLVYCIGNMTLCCLNLCYNNLAYSSILTLSDVLIHQSWQTSKASGLLRIGIEGNNLPDECDELIIIDEYIEKAQLAKLKVQAGRRPSEKKGKLSKANLR